MAIGEIHIQLAVNYASGPKMRKLLRYGADARGIRDLYVQMTCYCKDNLTDGFVPEEEVGVMCYPDTWENAQRDAGRLVEVGLVERVEDGFTVSAFLKRNKSKAQLEQDALEAKEAAIRGNHRRWHVNEDVINPDCPLCVPTSVPNLGSDRVPDRGGDVGGVSTESPESESESESESSTSKPFSSDAASQPSDDNEVPADDDDDNGDGKLPAKYLPYLAEIDALCKRLSERIYENRRLGGSKKPRPSITQDWRLAAGRLLLLDGLTVKQVETAIDWCQQDDWWAPNIESMPTLRKQFDKLRRDAVKRPAGRELAAAGVNGRARLHHPSVGRNHSQ